MSDDMTEKYRIFCRASGVWYLEEREGHHQVSPRNGRSQPADSGSSRSLWTHVNPWHSNAWV